MADKLVRVILALVILFVLAVAPIIPATAAGLIEPGAGMVEKLDGGFYQLATPSAGGGSGT